MKETFPLRSIAAQRYMLTATQKGILTDSLVASEKGVNVEQIIWQFEQVPDIEHLKLAWQSALESFDALRLRFCWPESEEPWQEIVESARMPFRVIDWSTMAAGQSFNLEMVLAQDRRLGFDLFQAPLCRVTVVNMGRFRTLCLWTIHHAIIDGASYATVLEYVRSQLELPSRVLQQQAQFVDFLGWSQKQHFDSGVVFYKNLLAGIDEPTPLPLRTDTTSVAQGSCATYLAKVSPDTSQKLLERARQAGASINTIVQLAWGIILGRYASVDDALFGATWSGRPGTVERPNDIVGPFINTLPVRVHFSPGLKLREALSALREQHLASRPFHHTPIHLIKAASGLSHVAHLFETIVVFEYARFDSILRSRDARWKRDYLASRSQPNYPLTLAVSGDGAQLEVELDYDVALYDRAQAAQLTADYLRVLEQIAESIDQSIAKIRLQDDATYNDCTAIEAAREIVAELPCPVFTILEGATRRGDAPAIEAIDGGTVSYAELVQQVAILAKLLSTRGIEKGVLVAALVPRSAAAIVALLAVQACGGVYVPLDPCAPPERLKFLLNDCDARLILVNSETQANPVLPSERTLNLDAVRSVDTAPALDVNDIALLCNADVSSPAYVIYTSGSTGEPKGVVVHHAALANHMKAVIERFELTPQDRVLQFCSLSFDVSLEEILPTLAVGAVLCLRGSEMAASARDFFAAVSRHNISVLNLPTAFWNQLVGSEHEWPASIRLLVIGGERANIDTYRDFRKAGTRHIRLLNGYGPTETTITSTLFDDAEGVGKPGLPIGRPLAGVSHFVLDQNMEPVPRGVVGELFIGGAGLAAGYLNRNSITRARFVPHPWREGERLYATGDRVWVAPGGHYMFVDRLDNQVKLRGYRIELSEIEERLRTHPFVRDAAVVVQPRQGTESALVGYVLAVPRKTTGELLKEHVAASLPHYMVPSRILLLDRFPINSSGKVDRRALENLPLPDLEESEPIPSLTDPLLRTLLQIWSDVLDKPVTDTSRSFFAHGGTSLQVVRLFALVEKRLGRSCNTGAFFKNPTVSALAEQLRESKHADWKAPVLQLAAGKPNVRPLFFAPGVVGRGLDFVHLANTLLGDIPLFALQMRGLAAADTPHVSLKAAAVEYADHIQSIQPEGPYGLSGYSAGGIVAMSIAAELYRRGERTDFVGLIDSTPPSTVPIPSPFSSPERAIRLLRTIHGRIDEALGSQMTFVQFAKRVSGALHRVASRWSLTAVPRASKLEEILTNVSAGLVPAQQKLVEDHLQMIMNHSFEVMPINIVLLRTRLDPFEGPHEPELGWQRVTSGPIRVEYLSLPHSELLTPEGAPEVARILERYLLTRRIDTKNTRPPSSRARL